MRKSWILAAVSALAASISSVHATPISASMSVTGHVVRDGDSTSDPESASWGTLLDPLSLTVDAHLTGNTGGPSVTANGSADATWGAGGNSGSVVFGSYGWSASEGASHSEADLNSAGPDWQYEFIADANGTFSMTYNVVGSLATSGLEGWNIGWSGLGGGLDLQNSADPTTSGVFTRSVLLGQDYIVSLQNDAHISCDCSISPGFMNGTFRFRISSAAPEPGTLGLLATALVAFGAFGRRRHNARKTA